MPRRRVCLRRKAESKLRRGVLGFCGLAGFGFPVFHYRNALRNPKISSFTIFALFVHRKMSNRLFVCSMFNMWQCVYGSSSKSYIRNKFWSSRTNNWLFCSFLTVLLTFLFYKWCRMTKMLNYFSKSVIVIRKNIKSSIEFVYSVFEFEIWWLCREVFQIKMTRFFSDILHKKYKTNFFLILFLTFANMFLSRWALERVYIACS